MYRSKYAVFVKIFSIKIARKPSIYKALSHFCVIITRASILLTIPVAFIYTSLLIDILQGRPLRKTHRDVVTLQSKVIASCPLHHKFSNCVVSICNWKKYIQLRLYRKWLTQEKKNDIIKMTEYDKIRWSEHNYTIL